jgi:adenylate cyclase class 2
MTAIKNNNIEIEGKILNIDPVGIAKLLLGLGASFVASLHYKRYVFELPSPDQKRWLRLRTDGAKTTLAVKEISDNTIIGTKEWEVSVSDMGTVLIILEKLGLQPKSIQENFRIAFIYEGTEVSLDFWPGLDPYLEIESLDSSGVYSTAHKLGFDGKSVTGKNTKELYSDAGVHLEMIANLKFTSLPAALTELMGMFEVKGVDQ